MSWADSPVHIHAVDFADVADGGVRCLKVELCDSAVTLPIYAFSCIGRGVRADHFLSDGEAEVLRGAWRERSKVGVMLLRNKWRLGRSRVLV